MIIYLMLANALTVKRKGIKLHLQKTHMHVSHAAYGGWVVANAR